MKTRMGQWAAAAVACLALTLGTAGAPAQAFSVGVHVTASNWYGWHRSWVSDCYTQPRSGHWGRTVQYDTWCRTNARYRDPRPDARWQYDHPWDHGAQSDRQRY